MLIHVKKTKIQIAKKIQNLCKKNSNEKIRKQHTVIKILKLKKAKNKKKLKF